MNDYIDLIDFKTVFKNKRYIIRVSPDVQEEEEATDIISVVENVGTHIGAKSENNLK
jgi:hypothetical protein